MKLETPWLLRRPRRAGMRARCVLLETLTMRPRPRSTMPGRTAREQWNARARWSRGRAARGPGRPARRARSRPSCPALLTRRSTSTVPRAFCTASRSVTSTPSDREARDVEACLAQRAGDHLADPAAPTRDDGDHERRLTKSRMAQASSGTRDARRSRAPARTPPPGRDRRQQVISQHQHREP